MRAESFLPPLEACGARGTSWPGVPLAMCLAVAASGCPSTPLTTVSDAGADQAAQDSGNAPDATHTPSAPSDAATARDFDAARDVDATGDATDAGDASVGAWDASLEDAAPDAADLRGLPDFGSGACTENPMPQDSLGTIESCPRGQWELRGELVADGGTSSQLLECVETADVPTDGEVFADYVESEYPRSGFAGYTTDDPAIFERRTSCASGVMYYYSDTPTGGIIHLHWTYVAP